MHDMTLGKWRSLQTWAAALALAGLATACDPMRVDKLEEGVSTEREVRAQFGEPATITERPDGSRVFDYPRQPEGWTNYRITLGPDGKMSALRQLLHADNLARVQAGQDQRTVRELLGRPATQQRWDLKAEEEWAWRFRPDGNRSQLFSVFFDRDGRVLRTGVADDPRDQAQAGR